MFQIDEDMTIYVTRGDIAFFSVSAEDNGELHKFQKGDVVRIKVFEKKNCENVAFQKDFAVTEECDSVNILLTEEETKIGDVVSKAKDYWYEIELNPYTNPQTIIGYDDDGAKIFKLFPEGRDLGNETREEDIPVVDSELSLTSTRPIENQAVARAILNIEGRINESKELNGSSLEKMEKQVVDSVNKTSKEIERMDTEVAMQRSRLNNLTSAEGEVTDVELELSDARVDHTGKAWANVGEHVRGVTSQLSEEIDELNGDLTEKCISDTHKYGDSFTGAFESSPKIYTDIYVESGMTYSIYMESDFQSLTVMVNDNNINQATLIRGSINTYTPPESGKLVIYKGSYTTGAKVFISIAGKCLKDYDTVESLKKDTSVVNGSIVRVRGYYSIGDSAEMIFTIGTIANENTFSILLDNGYYANREIRKGETISYRQFGAVMDGTYDDSNAVISAHNYANYNNCSIRQSYGTINLASVTDANHPIINTDCNLNGCTIVNDGTKSVLFEVSDGEKTSFSLTDGIIEAIRTNNTPFPTHKEEFVVIETSDSIGIRKFISDDTNEYFHNQTSIVDSYGNLENGMYMTPTGGIVSFSKLNIETIKLNFGTINCTGKKVSPIIFRRNNCILCNTRIKSEQSEPTIWAHSVFEAIGCCNLKFNDIVGNVPVLNESGKDTTAYIFLLKTCQNVTFENICCTKGHGFMASMFCTNIYIKDSTINRFDSHYGIFGVVSIENTHFSGYPTIVNLGYGDAIVNISKCTVYKYCENGLTPPNHFIGLRNDFAIFFNGSITVEDLSITNYINNNGYFTLLYLNLNNTDEPISYERQEKSNITVKNCKYKGKSYARVLFIFKQNNSMFNIDSVKMESVTGFTIRSEIKGGGDYSITANNIYSHGESLYVKLNNQPYVFAYGTLTIQNNSVDYPLKLYSFGDITAN